MTSSHGGDGRDHLYGGDDADAIAGGADARRPVR